VWQRILRAYPRFGDVKDAGAFPVLYDRYTPMYLIDGHPRALFAKNSTNVLSV
jgi:hypothetical protein